MSGDPEETELQRVTREAEEAEERLRRVKESVIPRDRVDALKDLFRAELASMMELTLPKYHGRLMGLKTEDEAKVVLEEVQQALLKGLDRVKTSNIEQMKAWTLA